MRTNFVILLSFMAITLFSQDITVPEVVLKSFNEKYPNIKKFKWEKKKTDYVVNFVTSRQQQATFDADGLWKKTYTILKDEDIPQSVIDMLLEDYDGYEIAEIKSIESKDDESAFQMKIVNDDNEKETLKFDSEWELFE